MTERPILFNGPMVRAILDGLKTQTRRVIKPQPPEWIREFGFTAFTPKRAISGRGNYEDSGPAEKFFKLPYGVPGDRLWVRETWRPEELENGQDGIRFCADKGFQNIDNTKEAADKWLISYDNKKCLYSWRPSIHMPRWASRINLEITDVRVQKIQDISESDAQAEGIQSFTKDQKVFKYWPCDPVDGDMKCTWVDLPRSNIEAFRCLWDSINLDRGFGWDKNPYVWTIDFRVITS